MTAAEQAHVMSHLAQLKDEGRIEVLRENRDHYHVFAFVEGMRPTEEFISATLGEARSGKLAEARTAKADRVAHHSRKKMVRAKGESKSVRQGKGRKTERAGAKLKRKSRR
jgi:hypothetical protein